MTILDTVFNFIPRGGLAGSIAGTITGPRVRLLFFSALSALPCPERSRRVRCFLLFSVPSVDVLSVLCV
jgi:hypothetical protein